MSPDFKVAQKKFSIIFDKSFHSNGYMFNAGDILHGCYIKKACDGYWCIYYGLEIKIGYDKAKLLKGKK